MRKADFNGEYDYGIAANRRVAEAIVQGLRRHNIDADLVTNRADDTQFSYRIVTKCRPNAATIAYAAAYIDGINDADRRWS